MQLAHSPEALNGAAAAQDTLVPPLPVGGLVVRKDDLARFLRAWVPQLQEIRVDESGELFVLLFGPTDPTKDERSEDSL
jgi:hypothetical protein